MRGCSGSAASAAPPLPGHFRLWGNVSTPWNPVYEAYPRTSSVLPSSESGRFELDEFRGASSAGDLPVRIKPVVAQTSGVPRVVRQDRAWVRPRSAPHAEPTGGSLCRRRDPTPWGYGEQRDIREERAIVTAFARWSNSPMSRLARRCGVAGSPPTNTILSCWSHTHAACADSFTLETTAPPLCGIGRQVCDESASRGNAGGNPGKECAARDPSDALQFRRGRSCSSGTRSHKVGPPGAMQVFMSRMLLGPSQGHWLGARRSSRSVPSTPTESCPLLRPPLSNSTSTPRSRTTGGTTDQHGRMRMRASRSAETFGSRTRGRCSPESDRGLWLGVRW
jgi:hypothetical protein